MAYPTACCCALKKGNTKKNKISEKMVSIMREEYDIENLNPRKNMYAAKLKKQTTININNGAVGRRFRSNLSQGLQLSNTEPIEHKGS